MKEVKIKDDRIRLKIPQKVELSLYRNDESKQYEIQLKMPWGNIYDIESYEGELSARARYTYLFNKLKKGKAVIEIGNIFSIIVEEE